VIDCDDGWTRTVQGTSPEKREECAMHLCALLEARDAKEPRPAIAREGRSVGEWRTHIARVVEGEGYRVPDARASLPEALSAPGATIEARVSAALALRASGGADAMTRIRVAASQCLDRSAREALDAVAEEEIDEAALDRALRKQRR
jgi:hypothetical protein